MFKKYEVIGAGICIGCMAAALYLVQLETNLAMSQEGKDQLAGINQSGAVIVSEGEEKQMRKQAIEEAADISGNVKSMIIDDIKVGDGAEVKAGDKVSVHYIGTLQDGSEFDNSKKRGLPFEFTVGGGQVIKGWDEGLLGMKVGGQRILVIPPEKAYGAAGAGPIPPNSTLVFAIELLEVK